MHSNVQGRVWIYWPGLARVRGNERTNSLASKPRITATMTLGRPEILLKINDNLMKSVITAKETTRVRLLRG